MRKEGITAKAQEQGFTLLEMIVSVTIVAMMSVALWSAFRISIHSWARGTELIDANQRHRSILDLVKKQMSSTYALVAPVDIQTGGVIYPIFTGTRDSVQFISLTSLRFHDNPGLTMVSYDVVRDRQGDYSLVEREEQYLGLDPSRESIFDRKDETVIPIFENLTSFSFEYLDPGTNERPPQWVKEWSARETQRLPEAISMAMISRDSKGQIFTRHMVIPLLAKPYDPRLSFINPLEGARPRRLGEDDPRMAR